MTRLASDSSSLIGYLRGRDLPPDVVDLLQAIATLELTAGYWERAGRTRAMILGTGRRARLADTLIAQICLDHDVSLVTNDSDLRSFSSIARLRVLP